MFKDTKERQMLKATMKAGGDESSDIWKRNDKQSGDKKEIADCKRS